MRGLLVTPWFAAGAGFVIAAALALHSPHTVLTYPSNTSPCAACIPHGSLATARPGLHFKAAQPAQPSRVSQGTAPTGADPASEGGPEIGFQVVGQQDGEFTAIITVPAAQARHGWKLRFEIPGRRILQVLGASWQPAPGSYGGLASMQTARTGLPGLPGLPGAPSRSRAPEPSGAGQRDSTGRSGGSGRPGDRWPGGPQARRFVVTAQGSPVRPVACVLNGVSCHFG